MEILPTTISSSSSSSRKFFLRQIGVLLITFLAYASFHASRKPPSIVKSALGSDSSGHGWAPFDGPRGNFRLGELDLAFLGAYSIAMYFAGHAGDRISLRKFLAFGMFASGIATIAFGLGFWWKIHSFGFFLAVQIVSGVFQSIGWPCVVAVVGNWFGKSKRGLIMGIWNSHTSVGNIVGSVIASSVLDYGWGWSFLVPGLLIILVGFLVLAFLVANPSDLGYEAAAMEIEMEGNSCPDGSVEEIQPEKLESATLLSGKADEQSTAAAIGFLEAWKLPRVAPYAFSLFFSKLVAYTFLYWLPFYIRNNAVGGKQLSNKTAGILSTIFDIGGVAGGITAGYISDKTGAQASTSLGFLFLSIPALVFYRAFGGVSGALNLALMFVSGFFVNGPYSLITTAVAADLGTQAFVSGGDSKALATVTAIIDGTGSVGAALGPLLTGYISTRGWNSVFLMLIMAISLSSFFLIHIARAELARK
ncbi:major facilitator superfamily protein [Wolffia australiana]